MSLGLGYSNTLRGDDAQKRNAKAMGNHTTILGEWKNCPICNAPMTKRQGRYGEFWGCTKFSLGCKGTAKVEALNEKQ